MTPRRDEESVPERRRSWDKIDEAGWESFPASDSPAWGPPVDTAIEPPDRDKPPPEGKTA